MPYLAALSFEYDKKLGINIKSLVIVSPDKGRKKLLLKLLTYVHARFCCFYKERREWFIFLHCDNHDFSGKHCIIIDDIDSGTTVCAVTDFLRKNGAERVYAMVTHGVFSQEFLPQNLSQIDALYITNSLPIDQAVVNKAPDKIHVLDIVTYSADFFLNLRIKTLLC